MERDRGTKGIVEVGKIETRAEIEDLGTLGKASGLLPYSLGGVFPTSKTVRARTLGVLDIGGL